MGDLMATKKIQSSKTKENEALQAKVEYDASQKALLQARAIATAHLDNIGHLNEYTIGRISRASGRLLELYASFTENEAKVEFGQKAIDCDYKTVKKAVSNSTFRQIARKDRELVSDFNKAVNLETDKLSSLWNSHLEKFRPTVAGFLKTIVPLMKKLPREKDSKSVSFLNEFEVYDGKAASFKLYIHDQESK